MTNWTPGVKADATKVVDLLTARYTNPTKDAIRKWVIEELKAAEPSLVLDLWGGGKSAAEMTAAGLNVLSVDDGRDAKTSHGVTAARCKRALAVTGDKEGYRTGWSTGDASLLRYLAECDAAWLDFMGHPCHTTERVLAACKGKKIVVLTLMASRLAGHEGLSVTSYIAMYRGLIEGLSGLSVRTVRKYKSAGDQWVLVFVAVRNGTSAYRAAYNRAYSATHREERRAYQRARTATHREEKLPLRRAYTATHREERRAYDAAHREKINARGRAYSATHREEIRAKDRAYRATHRAELSARQRARAAAAHPPQRSSRYRPAIKAQTGA